MFPTDFRDFLLAEISELIGTHVHVGAVPQSVACPYIWTQRAGTSHERTLDQAQGETPWEERWDLECISDDPEEIQLLADAVRRLDSATGSFGTGTMQRLYVEDQADDYVPRGVYSDEGLEVAAFSISVLGYQFGT